MNKPIREFAIKWNLSKRTIQNYCMQGLILPAEKNGKLKPWMIPEDWPKPPMSRHGLCNLMSNIQQIKSGASSSKMKWPKEKDIGFEYLIMAGFISNFDLQNFDDSIKLVSITPRGLELMEKDDEKNKKSKTEVTIGSSVNLGVVSLNASAKISNK